MTNSMTDRELYLLTECMEWKICDHIRCKARREIAELRSALNEARQRLVALGGDPVLDALNGDSRLADEPSANAADWDKFDPALGVPSEKSGAPLSNDEGYAMQRAQLATSNCQHEWGSLREWNDTSGLHGSKRCILCGRYVEW